METGTLAQRKWPKRMRRRGAVVYLREEHGIERAEKTLRNRHALGTGPRCEYFGSWWYTRPLWLDEWVEAERRDQPATRRQQACAIASHGPE
jgi:hypothetical protein